MQFTDDQKQLIQQIAQGALTDVRQFVEAEGYKIEGMNAVEAFAHKTPLNSGGADDHALKARIVLFVALYEKLKHGHLLMIINNVPLPNSLKIFNQEGVLLPLASEMLRNYQDVGLVAFADLQTFIDNGYVTAEEINQQAERKARVSAQRWTIGLSVAAMVVSSIISGYSYYTNSNERNVMLRNINDRAHPIAVEVVTPATAARNSLAPDNTQR